MVSPFGKKCNKCLIHLFIGTKSEATQYYGTQEARAIMLAHQSIFLLIKKLTVCTLFTKKKSQVKIVCLCVCVRERELEESVKLVDGTRVD